MTDQITINKSKLVSSLIYVALLALSVGAFYIGRNSVGTTVTQPGNDNSLTAKLQEAYLAGCTSAVLPANVQDLDENKYKTDRDICFSNSKNYDQN
jgi:hypothetical protein